MDENGPSAHTEEPRRIAPGSDPRSLLAPIVVLVLIVGVAVINPLGAASGPDNTPAVGTAPAAVELGADPSAPDRTAGATSEAASADPADLSVTCGSPSGWRVATLQEWIGRPTPIRSWIAVDPVEAAGPLDPSVPFVPVATDVVVAIGYCSPLDDARRPPEVTETSIWAVGDGAALPLTPVPIEPPRPNALGGLWDPSPELGGTTAPGWPPGRYVIEISSPSGTFDRWLGLEIENLQALHASPLPSPGLPSVAPGSREPSVEPSATP